MIRKVKRENGHPINIIQSRKSLSRCSLDTGTNTTSVHVGTYHTFTWPHVKAGM